MKSGPARSVPNLLYIISDQHSPLVTGCYGDSVVKTPNLDALASSGIVMENTYCPSPICGPSRMAMLTGLHPYQNYCWTNRDILDSGIPTVAHSLGAAGYQPTLIGRLHSMGPDQLRGYTKRLIGDHSPNYFGAGPDIDRGELNAASGPSHISLLKSGSGQSGYELHDDQVTEATLKFLSAEADRRKQFPKSATKPFCLTVGFMLPHPPYVARSADYNYYKNRIKMPQNPLFPETDLPDYLEWWHHHTGLWKLSDSETIRSRTAYWGLVTSLDRMIGKIITQLNNSGLIDNTLIIYTSDHGDMLGEHGMFWKHTFYEESVKVPLIMSWPKVIKSGTRSQRVVSSLDVTSTILDAMKAPELPGTNMRSMLPMIENGDWADEAFSEYCSNEEWAPPNGCYQRMIRRDNWKLNYYSQPGTDQCQLFNLFEDPNELVNLSCDRRHKDIKNDLVARILTNWNPNHVKKTMALKSKQQQIQTTWAEQTQPHNNHFWQLEKDMWFLNAPDRQ